MLCYSSKIFQNKNFYSNFELDPRGPNPRRVDMAVDRANASITSAAATFSKFNDGVTTVLSQVRSVLSISIILTYALLSFSKPWSIICLYNFSESWFGFFFVSKNFQFPPPPPPLWWLIHSSLQTTFFHFPPDYSVRDIYLEANILHWNVLRFTPQPLVLKQLYEDEHSRLANLSLSAFARPFADRISKASLRATKLVNVGDGVLLKWVYWTIFHYGGERSSYFSLPPPPLVLWMNCWPGLCCYQPACVVSQQSWLSNILHRNFLRFTPPPLFHFIRWWRPGLRVSLCGPIFSQFSVGCSGGFGSI